MAFLVLGLRRLRQTSCRHLVPSGSILTWGWSAARVETGSRLFHGGGGGRMKSGREEEGGERGERGEETKKTERDGERWEEEERARQEHGNHGTDGRRSARVHENLQNIEPRRPRSLATIYLHITTGRICGALSHTASLASTHATSDGASSIEPSMRGKGRPAASSTTYEYEETHPDRIGTGVQATPCSVSRSFCLVFLSACCGCCQMLRLSACPKKRRSCSRPRLCSRAFLYKDASIDGPAKQTSVIHPCKNRLWSTKPLPLTGGRHGRGKFQRDTGQIAVKRPACIPIDGPGQRKGGLRMVLQSQEAKSLSWMGKRLDDWTLVANRWHMGQPRQCSSRHLTARLDSSGAAPRGH